MGRRKQNKTLEHKLTKPCYVLLHKLPQSQLLVLEDKMLNGEGKKEDGKEKTSNHFQSSSGQKRAHTPNASKLHKLKDKTTNDSDTKTHVRRETRLSKKLNKEKRYYEATDRIQDPITGILRWHFKKGETKSVGSEGDTTSMKPESSKSVVRLGFDIYVEEFKKYLYSLREKSKTNSNLYLLDSELDKELMSLNDKFEYDVNKRLVERIIKNFLNVEVSLEGQWKNIKIAIIEAENEVLSEKLGNKKPGKRMAQESSDFQKQKIQKLSEKINEPDDANRNLSKTSTKIHVFEENKVTVKMMDIDQSTSERETAPSNDLQSTIMMSKKDSTPRNSELKHDETLVQDYDSTSNLLPNDDPESNGIVDNTDKLDWFQKPLNESDNIVLKARDQLESLGTSQTIEKLIEYKNSQEHSNESRNDTDLKNCEQQERLFAKQKNDAVSLLENGNIGNTVVEVSNNSSEHNTHARQFCISKRGDIKPDCVTVEDSVVKVALDKTSVTKNEASFHSATLSPVADIVFNQDTVERRDSSLQNVIPTEENTLFVNRLANNEVLQLINEIIDNVVSKKKAQIFFDPPSVFPCSTSDSVSNHDNAKGNENSLPGKFVSSISKKNFPSIDCPTNDKEIIQLVSEVMRNVLLETKKQNNCEGHTVFSCSATDLKSDPDSAEKRLSPPTKASPSLLENSFTVGDESLNKTPENMIRVSEIASCYEAQAFSDLSCDKESVPNTEKQGSLPADVEEALSDEEAVKLITKTIENLCFKTKEQTNCDVHILFSSSTSGLKSNPDNAKKRPFSPTKASTPASTSVNSDNNLEDSLKTASVESTANNFTFPIGLDENEPTYNEISMFDEDSKRYIEKKEEEMLNSRYCKNSFKYEILKYFYILRSEYPVYREKPRQNNEEKCDGFKIAPKIELKDLAEKPKDDKKPYKKQEKKWP